MSASIYFELASRIVGVRLGLGQGQTQQAPGPRPETLRIEGNPLKRPHELATSVTIDGVRPLSLQPVVRCTREGKRWNEFIARYHYLGYKTLVDAQMRYAVYDRDG